MAAKERYRLLYDGACPICSREVLWLHRRRPDAIEAVDIAAEGFDAYAYGLSSEQVDAALYGIRPDKAFAVQLCQQAVNRLFDISGGHGIFESAPLQRFHRDAQAVAHRDGLVMDLGGRDYGRAALGLPPEGPV